VIILDSFRQNAREALDYTLDLTRELERDETVASASATITPDTAFITRVEFDDRSVATWVTGGVDRERYTVSVTIDTSGGRRLVKNFVLQMSGDLAQPPAASIADTTATIGYAGDPVILP